VKRIAVATQGADAYAFVFEFLLELLDFRGLAQPLELQMRVANVVSGSELKRADPEWFYLFDDLVQTELAQERREESDLQIASPSCES
jgi:hypothetical protein